MQPVDLLRLPMRFWYWTSLSRSDTIPSPRDSPCWSDGLDAPIRVLLLGNGPCHGWGVATHELALTGHLGREVAQRTGRGCEVDYVGSETMTVDTAEAQLMAWPRRDYDAAVVILGINDAVRLTSPRRWELRLRSLLERLDRELPDAVEIVLGDIPPLRSLGGYDDLVGRLAQPRADQLNAVLRTVVSRMARVRPLDVPPAPKGDTATVQSASDAYAGLASIVADRLIPALRR